MFLDYLNKHKFSLVFISFIFLYFFLYAPIGYDDADNGYTLGLSWRILNGEISYRDFILVRPPLSPFFHALPLYFINDNYQIIFDRFLFYLLIAASSLFATFSISKLFDFKNLNLNPYLLATVGFVFSVHNFPPMAWHTVDGVFFASIGIFILVNYYSLPCISFGIIFLFLSALCKQPYYMMPFAGILYIIIIYKNWVKTIIALITFLFCSVLFFLVLNKFGILKNFAILTSGSTSLRDLFMIGFVNYFKINILYLLIPFALWIVARIFQNNKYKVYRLSVIPYFFISISLFLPLSIFLLSVFIKNDPDNIYFNDIVANMLFCSTITYFLLSTTIEKNRITLIFLTILSWCSSISWGHQSPSFFSVPLIFGFLMISIKYFDVKNISRLVTYMLVLGTITYYCAMQKPYGNPVKKNITYSLSDIFPKLNNILVSKETYEKYHEFSILVKKYGINFKTLPGMPLSNYLTNTKSPINIDWVFNAETGTYNNQIISILQQKKTIIFLEKKPLFISVTNSTDKYNSLVTYYIKTNWKKIDSTNYFDIYKFEK